MESDEDKIDVISIISLIRLMEGGAAILVALKTNHHRANRGKTLKSPLVRNSLRVEVNS